MYYRVLANNVIVVSRTTVSRITNIEAQTNENKARISAFDKSIQERLNDKAHIIVEGGKVKKKDCSDHPFDHNPYFQEEFDHTVSNE